MIETPQLLPNYKRLIRRWLEDRAAKGVTLTALSDRAEVRRATISDFIHHADRGLTVSNLEKIVAGCNKIDRMLSRRVPRPTPDELFLARTNAGLSTEEAAEKSGVSPSLIQSAETSAAFVEKMNGAELARLAKAYGLKK